MKTLGFLGVAHIHTPELCQTRQRIVADQFKVKAVWDDRSQSAREDCRRSISKVAHVVDQRLATRSLSDDRD